MGEETKMDKIPAMTKYPKMVAPSIFQYDENVFVWMDETENVGGAAPTLGDAKRQLDSYAFSMGRNHHNDILEIYRALYMRQEPLGEEFDKVWYNNIEDLYEE